MTAPGHSPWRDGVKTRGQGDLTKDRLVTALRCHQECEGKTRHVVLVLPSSRFSYWRNWRSLPAGIRDHVPPGKALTARPPGDYSAPHPPSSFPGLKTDVKAGWDLPVWLEGRNLFYFSGHGEPWEHLRQGHLDEGADFRDDPGNV